MRPVAGSDGALTPCGIREEKQLKDLRELQSRTNQLFLFLFFGQL